MPVRVDLSVRLNEIDGGALAGAIRYSTVLFDAATMRRLAGHLVTLLAGVAEDPELAVADLPVLTAGERDQLLTDWAGAAGPKPDVASVAELITARAAGPPMSWP